MAQSTMAVTDLSRCGVPSAHSFQATATASSHGLCLTEDRLSFTPSRLSSCNDVAAFSSPGYCASIPRGQESLAPSSYTSFQPLGSPHCASAIADPSGCGPIVSGLTTTIEAAMGAARESRRNHHKG